MYPLRTQFERLFVDTGCREQYFKILSHQFLEKENPTIMNVDIHTVLAFTFLGDAYLAWDIYPELIRYFIICNGSNVIQCNNKSIKYLQDNDNYIVDRINAYLDVIYEIYKQIYVKYIQKIMECTSYNKDLATVITNYFMNISNDVDTEKYLNAMDKFSVNKGMFYLDDKYWHNWKKGIVIEEKSDDQLITLAVIGKGAKTYYYENVSLIEPIFNIMKRIEETQGVPPVCQMISFFKYEEACNMNHKHCLADYNVMDGDTIQCYINYRMYRA